MFSRKQVFRTIPTAIESLDAEASKSLFRGFLTKKPTLEGALFSAGIQKYELIIEDSMVYANRARENTEINALGLTDDEAGAISCYTLQLEYPGIKSPYELINEGLSGSRNSTNLNSIRRFLYLLLSGLRKLSRFSPSSGEIFYRGIRSKVPQNEKEATKINDKGQNITHQYYEKDKTVTWWGFTSTTTDLDKVNIFIEGAPESTMFNIGGSNLWGYDIKLFSPFPEEEEILLEPEARVFVKGIISNSKPLVINVALQNFDHLVLEDIIPVGGIKNVPTLKIPAKSKRKTSLSIKKKKAEDNEDEKANIQIPQGLNVKNSLFKGFELSWHSVVGKAVSYQAGIIKNGSGDKVPRIFYQGVKTYCSIKRLEVGAEYMFKVRCSSGTELGEWSEMVAKRVESLNVEMAVSTLNKCTSDDGICIDVLSEIVHLMKEGKANEKQLNQLFQFKRTIESEQDSARQLMQ